MRIALVHKDPVAREILTRALRQRLHLRVSAYRCIEDWMLSALPYDLFIVYKDLGHKMNGVQGVKLIRAQNSGALIIGVSNAPHAEREFLQGGADAFLLRSGNEVQELGDLALKLIAQWVNTPARAAGG